MGQGASFEPEESIIKKLEGHTKAITAVAFSDDGSILATCSEDTDIILWDTSTGEKIRSLASHNAAITCCSFNESLLATGAQDGLVILWQYMIGKKTSRLAVHAGPITSCAFAPDGRSLASSSKDKTARVFKIKPGAGEFVPGDEIKTLEGHRGAVNCVQFNYPDGDHIATASSDRTIRLWERTTGRSIWVSSVTQGKIYDLKFSHRGPFLAALSEECISVWNTDTLTVKFTFEEKTKKNILSIDYTTDGAYLVAGCRDNSLVIYNNYFHKQQPEIKFAHHSKGVKSVKFSPSGKQAATGGGDSVAILWNVPEHPTKPHSPLPQRHRAMELRNGHHV